MNPTWTLLRAVGRSYATNRFACVVAVLYGIALVYLNSPSSEPFTQVPWRQLLPEAQSWQVAQSEATTGPAPRSKIEPSVLLLSAESLPEIIDVTSRFRWLWAGGWKQIVVDGEPQADDLRAAVELIQPRTVIVTSATWRRLHAEYPAGLLRPMLSGTELVLPLWSMLPVLVLLHLLAFQCSVSGAALRPGYLQTQGGVASGLLLLIVGIPAALMWHDGLDFWACLVWAGSPLLITVLVGAIVNRRGTFPGYTQSPIILVLLMYVFCGYVIVPVAGLMAWFGVLRWMAEAEAYFHGLRPGWTVLVFACEVVALWWHGRFFVALSRRDGSVGAASTLDGPTFGWRSRWSAAWSALVRLLPGSDPEERLRQALAAPAGSRHRARLLWRAAVQYNPWQLSIGAICMTTVILIILPSLVTWILSPYFPGSFAPWTGAVDQQSLSVWLLICGWLSSIMVTLYFVQERSGALSRHLLMSEDRQVWVRLAFSEAAREYLPPAILIGLGLAILSPVTESMRWSIIDLLVFSSGVLAAVYGGAVLLVTIPKTAMLKVTVGLLLAVFAWAITWSALMSYLNWHSDEFVTILRWMRQPISAWAPIFAGSITMIAYAYHRWLTCEFEG